VNKTERFGAAGAGMPTGELAGEPFNGSNELTLAAGEVCDCAGGGSGEFDAGNPSVAGAPGVPGIGRA
jgi:hypothetical protein